MTKTPNIRSYPKGKLAEFLANSPIEDWNSAVSEARIKDPRWGPDLSGVSLKKLDLRKVDLRFAKLKLTDFHESDLKGAYFNGAQLLAANLSITNLEGATFAETDLREANLEDANLYQAVFNNSDLTRTNLSHADLRYVNFWQTRLVETDLQNTNLGFALMLNSTLRLAKIRNTNLQGVKFSGSELSGVCFSKTNIWEADLTGVTISMETVDQDSHENEKSVLLGPCHHAGIIGKHPVLVFAIKESPGYMICYDLWLGDMPEFLTHIERALGPNSIELKQAKITNQLIESVIREWPKVIEHELPILGTTPDSPASYLTAEANRTGISPTDIILGDE